MKYLDPSFSVYMGNSDTNKCEACKNKNYVYKLNGKKYCPECYKLSQLKVKSLLERFLTALFLEEKT